MWTKMDINKQPTKSKDVDPIEFYKIEIKSKICRDNLKHWP
jgi:hypothetical protein